MLSKAFKVAVACVVFCGLPVFSAPILISNTGVGGVVGGIDPNWNIFGTGAAYVTSGSPADFPFGGVGWLSNDGTSQWISPQASYIPGVNDPEGGWPFSTTFDLTGFNPATAVIVGRYVADNQLISINGVLQPSAPRDSFQTWTSFTINSGFVSGINTLVFDVDNNDSAGGGPVGLRVEFTSAEATPESVPEPATLVLLGAGLMGLGLLRRKTSRP